MRGKTMAGVMAVLAGFGLTVAVAAEEAKSQVILDGHSQWRAQLQVAGAVIRHGGDKLQGHPARLDALPENWTAIEFDDTGWVCTPGPFFTGKYEAGFQGWESATPSLALICVRNKFTVTDPAHVESLTLDMNYRGGVVVYLNGKELLRQHLPEGKIEPWTLAEDYPKEAYLRPDGVHIRHAYGDPEKNPDRIAMRRRHIKGFAIPATAIRKGVNVIAIELHRAPYDEAGTQKTKNGTLVPWGGKSYKSSNDLWATVGLTRFELKAVGSGIRSGRMRPKGFQVWNADPVMPVYDTDFGPVGADPLPVHIEGVPNGRFAGVLAVGSDQPIRGLKAEVADLRAASGAVIPAASVTVRYQKPGVAGADGERIPGVKDIRGFDALAEQPPTEIPVRTKSKRGGYPVVFGAVCPIWLTVHVPEATAVGLYEGICRIAADGVETVEVPVLVNVCSGWTLPEPQQLRTLTGFHQSPETVAMHYKVPFWSDEHFGYLGESFKWLGSVGCKTIFLHAIERTNLGNAESIVRWKRKAGTADSGDGNADGAGKKALPTISLATHEPDFTAADRYLDVALQHLGQPPVICLYAWDNYCGTWYSGGANNSHNVKPDPVLVTEVVDGKTQSALGPVYTNLAESVAFWRPVAEHFAAYLKERGLEQSLMVGLAHDSHPGGYVVEVWKQLLPKMPWAFEGHPRASSLKSLSGDVSVDWGCTVWGARMARHNNRKPGWSIAQMQCHFDRDCWRGSAGEQLLSVGYLAGERNIAGDQRGFGRVSADLWPVVKDSRGRMHSISHRYPESNWGACNVRMIPFVQPGPKGAISTGRLEMIREGLQECEARIVIETALLDKATCAKLGPDMEKRCWALLNRRVSAIHSAGGRMGRLVFLGSGRQIRSRELFELAAEVEKILAAK